MAKLACARQEFLLVSRVHITLVKKLRQRERLDEAWELGLAANSGQTAGGRRQSAECSSDTIQIARVTLHRNVNTDSCLYCATVAKFCTVSMYSAVCLHHTAGCDEGGRGIRCVPGRGQV